MLTLSTCRPVRFGFYNFCRTLSIDPTHCFDGFKRYFLHRVAHRRFESPNGFVSTENPESVNGCESDAETLSAHCVNQHGYILTVTKRIDVVRPHSEDTVPQPEPDSWIHSWKATQKSSPMEK